MSYGDVKKALHKQTIQEKVDHVRAAANLDPLHHCHWPGCKRRVKPAVWGCYPHWQALPTALRRRIWATYRIGQEDSKTPSAEYLEVARAVQEWIKTHYPPKP